MGVFDTAKKKITDLVGITSKGQATMANSLPVTIASNQDVIATAANQTTANTSLASVDTKLSSQATAANQTAQATLIGAVTETAPASDTASSGLNGRLQRIAQRISSLIALIPAALTGSGNFKTAIVETFPALSTTHQSAVATATADGSNATLNGLYSVASIYVSNAGSVAATDYAVCEVTNDITGVWNVRSVYDVELDKWIDKIPLNFKHFKVDVAGFKFMRVRIVANAAGTVTITSQASQVGSLPTQPPITIETDHHVSATASANGTSVLLSTVYNEASVQVYSAGAGVYSIIVEGCYSAGFAANDTTVLEVKKLGTLSKPVTAITSDGIYRVVGLSTFTYFRARLVRTSGTISVKSFVTRGTSGVFQAPEADLLTAAQAIQAAAEDTTGLTPTNALKTGADGWQTTPASAATGALSGTITVPEGARKAIISVVNATDVTFAGKVSMFDSGNSCVIMSTADTVLTGASQAWFPLAGNTGTTGKTVAALGALVPGLPLAYSFGVTSRTTGTYTVTFYWGS